MDRNSIIGILLIIAILFGYQYLTMPSAEERVRMQHEQDSIAEVAIQKQAHHADSALSVQQQEVKEAVATAPVDTALVADSVNTDSILAAKQLDRFGIFGPTASGRNEVITIANENLQIAINTFGARPNVIRLKGYKTYHGRKPLLLSVPDSGAYEYNDQHEGHELRGGEDRNHRCEAHRRHHRPLEVLPDHLPAGQCHVVHERDRGAGRIARGGPAQRDVPLEPHRLPQ